MFEFSGCPWGRDETWPSPSIPPAWGWVRNQVLRGEAELLLKEPWAGLGGACKGGAAAEEKELKNIKPEMKTQGESGVPIPVNTPFL